jgi:hydrogenase nickel incorporation protein HypA/HybF
MHELSIARAVVAEVEDAARRHDATSVSSVTLSVGRLAAITPGALHFGFELASQGTLLSGAELIIQTEPLIVWCPEGEHPVELDDLRFVCPVHGCATPEMLSGKQLEILRFETGPASGAVSAAGVQGGGADHGSITGR